MTSAALIPMLGRQARQFNRNGPFRHLFVDHASVYNEIRRRLQEEASEHRRVALSNSGSQPTTPLSV